MCSFSLNPTAPFVWGSRVIVDAHEKSSPIFMDYDEDAVSCHFIVNVFPSLPTDNEIYF